jgi:hypothetical protein
MAGRGASRAQLMPADGRAITRTTSAAKPTKRHHDVKTIFIAKLFACRSELIVSAKKLVFAILSAIAIDGEAAGWRICGAEGAVSEAARAHSATRFISGAGAADASAGAQAAAEGPDYRAVIEHAGARSPTASTRPRPKASWCLTGSLRLACRGPSESGSAHSLRRSPTNGWSATGSSRASSMADRRSRPPLQPSGGSSPQWARTTDGAGPAGRRGDHRRLTTWRWRSR